MAGRFPPYTDADIRGPLVKALRNTGWDIVRAIDEMVEGTKNPPHFERAVKLGRVLVTNDAGRRRGRRSGTKQSAASFESKEAAMVATDDVTCGQPTLGNGTPPDP